MIKLGLYQHGINWNWEKVRDYWLEADRLGFYSGWMMDNVVYADLDSDRMLPVWETWTVLSILAEITDNIRIGPMVTPCRRQEPLSACQNGCMYRPDQSWPIGCWNWYR